MATINSPAGIHLRKHNITEAKQSQQDNKLTKQT